jgi:hypothetical protein
MNAFTNFDTGGSGGSEGPWVQWSARGTLDGAVAAKSFLIRDQDGKKKFDGFDTGVVLDISTMKTGWCYSSGAQGEAPDWKMNASLAQFAPDPSSGDRDYKKGFKIRCAIGGGKTASWDQAGASVWNAFVALVPELQKQPSPDMLPLVRCTGAKFEQFKRGSTNTPILEVVKWVPRPDCLKEGAAAGIATDPAPAAAAPAPAAAHAAIPDEAAF